MMQKTLKVSLTVMFLVLVIPVLSWAWQGKITLVTDGDTMTIVHEGKKERLRLYGLDCPDKNQDFGLRAKQFTSDMILGKEVEVEAVTKDRYGYTVSIVKLDGQILNRKLIEAGLAWVDLKLCYRKECHAWSQLQDQAQKTKVGLWSAPGPIPPWEFKNPNKKNLRSHPQTKNEETDGQPLELYHGDVVNHIFHIPGCQEFNCKNCIAAFRSKKAASKAGYKPCEMCSP